MLFRSQTYKDKGFDFKLRLLKESSFLPQVAVGFRDIAGSGTFSAEYLVASKFYYAKNSAAYAPHILLEDIGVKYEAVLIDFKAGEQRSPAYLAVNPKGRLPSLVTERGVLTETLAILVYLAQTHPEHGLIPSDPFDFEIGRAHV